MQRRHVLGEGTLVAPQQVAGLGFQREQLVAGRGHEHHAVVDDRRRLMALDLAGGVAPDRLQASDIALVDFLERAIAPPIIGAPEQEPVAGLRILQPLGGDRSVFLQDFRHRSRHRSERGRRDRLLCRCRGHAHGNGCNADALHECLASDHDVSSSLLPRERGLFDLRLARVAWCLLPLGGDCAALGVRIIQVGMMPTRAVNGLATASLPSTILSGSAGNARVAGPSMTVAPSRGL